MYGGLLGLMNRPSSQEFNHIEQHLYLGQYNKTETMTKYGKELITKDYSIQILKLLKNGLTDK